MLEWETSAQTIYSSYFRWPLTFARYFLHPCVLTTSAALW